MVTTDAIDSTVSNNVLPQYGHRIQNITNGMSHEYIILLICAYGNDMQIFIITVGYHNTIHRITQTYNVKI